MYKPLPESVTIKPSGVHGLGLFADQKIKPGTNLGATHLEVDDKIIRTPLGGFINHSNTPNCVKLRQFVSLRLSVKKKWNLVVKQDIKKGDELTVRYTFYKI